MPDQSTKFTLIDVDSTERETWTGFTIPLSLGDYPDRDAKVPYRLRAGGEVATLPCSGRTAWHSVDAYLKEKANA